jgi:spore photoproduct lyase
MRFPIRTVLIDDDVADEPLVAQVLQRTRGARVLRGKQARDEMRRIVLSKDPFLDGKRTLRLLRHKGAFVKPCPGTREYLCCGLMIIHGMQGCPMDCRYCALQTYFNRPTLEVFVNTDDLFRELDSFLCASHKRFHRFCTGEFADSLALDRLTGLSERLIGFFAGRNDASLELKTKSDCVSHLLGMNPQSRIIMSFSVNSIEVVARHELRSASLDRRLDAASRACRAGYLVGFHFDPIVPLPGWAPQYHQAVDAVFDKIDPSVVVWISLGALRFVPDLKTVATARSGPEPLFHDGFHRGLDGKSRIAVERRIEVYRSIAERIRLRAPDVTLYLCMESAYVWEKALGFKPEAESEVAALLDRAVSDRRNE